MNRVVVDVTQLVHWGGKLTGIPRVMHEIAVRYQALGGQDVIFASWVKEIRAMCEVDLGATLAHRGHGIEYLKEGMETPIYTQVVRGTDTPAKQPLTPKAFLKKATIKTAKVSVAGAARISPRVANAIDWRAKQYRMKNYKRVAFQPGDKLFIPWGEWWDPNFIAELKRLQQENVRLVPVIHDLGPVVLPNLSGHSTDSLSSYCRQVVPLAHTVLTVSQNTKKDLIAWLKSQKLHVPKIEIFRLGDSIEIATPKPPTDPLFTQSGLKGGDFLLCVGTIEIKKNHFLLYYTYKLAKAKGITLPKMVMVGRPGWQTEGIIEIMSKDPDGDFIFLLNCPDEELSWLFGHCLFTVLPSFYEGWGIPIAESLARGTPCLCSNTSSMVEIAPGITEHFSPYSPEECLAGIQRWLDPKALESARERTATYQQFSWDDSFAQVKNYLEEI